MKVKELLAITKKMGVIVKRNAVVVACECIMVKDGYVYGTNLQTNVIIKADLPGHYTVLNFELSKLLSSLNKDAEVELVPELKGAGVTIECEGNTFTLEGVATEEFPKTHELTELIKIGTLTKEDMDMVAIAAEFASKDELRQNLTCVNIDKEEITATDANFLYHGKLKGQIDEPFLFHTPVLPLLKGAAVEVYKDQLVRKDATVSIEKYMLAQGDTIVWMYNVNERYPDYRAVIPQDNPIKMAVDKKRLAAVIKTITGLKPKKAEAQHVKFDFQKGKLDITYALPAERVGEPEKVLYKGSIPMVDFYLEGEQSFQIGFDTLKLVVIVKNTVSDKVEFEMSSPKRAAIFEGDKLLMPTMLSA